MERKLRHVLLLLDWYSPLLHIGVARYAKTHNWHLVIRYNYHRSLSVPIWNGDGIIVNGEWFKVIPSGIPTVAVSYFPEEYPFQLVREDDVAIGRIAAEYFLAHGFRNVATYSAYEMLRQSSFSQYLIRRGIRCHTLLQAEWVVATRELPRLSAQLRQLPHPCAVFCENDLYAYDIVGAALAAGLAIPDEIAILGVGNDELICESGNVTLSAIDNNLDQVGYRAAEELDRLMDGREPGRPVLISPQPEVVQRMSSDVYAVKNPKLREILTFLQRNCTSPLVIAEVAARYSLCESAMYKLFRRNLNASPAEVLVKLRLARALSLLKESDLKIGAVASEAGFGDLNAMYCAFRKYLRSTPGKIRSLQSWRESMSRMLREGAVPEKSTGGSEQEE